MTDATTRIVDRVERQQSRRVVVPGSKSIANRALICAALADGTSTLTGVPDGDDTAAMVSALDELGFAISSSDADDRSSTIRISGGRPAGGTAWADLAGTTSRFLLGLAAVGSEPITVDGGEPLRRRPMGPLIDALRSIGADVDATDGRLPATVTGPAAGGDVAVRGDVSSQFISALMLVAPVLADGVRIAITGELVSRPYVDLTARVMASFGHHGVTVTDTAITVTPGRYRATEFAVEADASSASYPLALAAATGATVVVPGLDVDSSQGDIAILDLLAEMGCRVETDHGPGRETTVTGPGGPLHGIDVDMAHTSDLVPTIAVLACLADGPSRIRGVGFIRAKESDRLGDLATELRRCGAVVDVLDDGLAIDPSVTRLRGTRVDTHHDHRLAMALAVLGAAIGSVEIVEPGVVTKSWPGFWEMLAVFERNR